MDLRTLLITEAARINAVIEEDLSRLSKRHEPLLIEVLHYGLLGGGKRVRPFLLLNAAALCGRRGAECDELAIAFEYLHAATLFHDDIIDQSELRRGRPAVHSKFGMVAAILAGDFLLTHSMEIVGEYTGQRGLKSFNLATKGMVDGEFYQQRNADTVSLKTGDYDEAVMRKTSLLIAGACEVGGLFAGGSEEEVAALRCYGENLGRAFQIVDDQLDYLGDTTKTGKAVGNDLQEGKMTLPLLLAVQQGEGAARERLLEIISSVELRQQAENFSEVKGLIETCGGFTAAREEAEKTMARGISALDLFSAPAALDARDRLAALGQFVLHREK